MASSAEKYVHENYWVFIVAGILVVIISGSIFIICCLCCVHRRQKRRGGMYYVNLRNNLEDSLRYGTMEMQKGSTVNNSSSMISFSYSSPSSSMSVTVAGRKREEGVAEAWNNQRKRRETSEREAAQLVCQYYLRNTKAYTLSNPLPDLGSRVAKYWFLVTTNGITGQRSSLESQMILTLLPVSKHCPIGLRRDNLKLLNKLFAALKHPFLYSVERVDYLSEHSSIVMVTTLFQQGSLKDVIYKRQPIYEWSEKYSVRRRGLPPETVALYGRQILEALRMLYRKGFPPLGNIQSGNIFVDGKICRLSGYENTLLGYRSRQYRLVKGYPDTMDTIMFGHLLFEMMCGYELTTLSPSNSDWQNVKDDAQLEVLKYIFSGAEQDNVFPNIVEILNLPFFKSVKLPELENWDSSQIQLSADMKGLLKGVRRGRLDSLHDRERPASKRRTFATPDNYYPVTQVPHITRGTSTPSQQPSRPPPPPPTTHPPPAPSSHSPHPPSEKRGALLTDIKRGTNLKKIVTHDRSAPRI